MDVITNADARNILRPQFRQRPVPPAPRLGGDPVPEDAQPAMLLGMSIGVLAAEIKRIRIVHGDEAVDIAIQQAKLLSV